MLDAHVRNQNICSSSSRDMETSFSDPLSAPLSANVWSYSTPSAGVTLWIGLGLLSALDDKRISVIVNEWMMDDPCLQLEHYRW